MPVNPTRENLLSAWRNVAAIERELELLKMALRALEVEVLGVDVKEIH